MTGRRRIVVMAALVALAVRTASADWQDDYRDGISAADARRWQEVATLMRRAIASNPQESGDRMRIYGMRFEPYLPHFFLGLALSELGDCQGAMAALESSLSAGVVQQTTRLADVRRIQEACRSALPTPTPTPPPAPTATPTPAGPDPADLAAAERELASALDEADAARAGFEAVRGRRGAAAGLQRDTTIEASVREADAELASARATAGSGDLDALRAGSRSARAARDAYLGAASRLESVPAAAVQPAPTRTPTPRPTATPGPTLSPPPAESTPRRPERLDTAAAAWLAGRPAEVVTVLEDVDMGEPRATAVAMLLRSAARWSLWREGGQRDAQLHAEAVSDAGACIRMDPAVEPFVDAFPPGYVTFFRTITP